MMLQYWLADNEEVFARLEQQTSLRKHGEYWEQNPAEYLTSTEEALISLLIYTAGYTLAVHKNGQYVPEDERLCCLRVMRGVSLAFTE